MSSPIRRDRRTALAAGRSGVLFLATRGGFSRRSKALPDGVSPKRQRGGPATAKWPAIDAESSASLAPHIMLALEEAFKVPVIEAYGMTEASHQMTSNPLPPTLRKPRSVGMAAGPAVAIMDEYGRMLKTGEIGEIVIGGIRLGLEDTIN